MFLKIKYNQLKDSIHFLYRKTYTKDIAFRWNEKRITLQCVS